MTNLDPGESFWDLFEYNPFPVIVFELEKLKIIRTNKAALELFGELKEGTELKKLISNESIDNIKFQDTNGYNYLFLKQDGTNFFSRVHSSIISINNKPAKWVLIKDLPGTMFGNPVFDFQIQVLSKINDAVILFNLNHEIIYWNEKATSILGYELFEVLGKNASLFFQENLNFTNTGIKPYNKYFNDGINLQKNKKGENIYTEASVSLLKDRKESPLGVLIILKDVTEKKDVEKRLRYSRQELETILDNIADGISVQDKDGNIVYFNKAAAALSGLELANEDLNLHRQAILDRFELMDEDDHPFPLERLPGRRILEGGKEASEIIKFRNKNTRTEKYSIIQATPVYNDDGSIRLAISYFRDITEKIQSDKILKFSENRFRMLFEQAPMSSQIFNPDGFIVQVNTAWESLWGIKMEDIPDYNVLEDEQLLKQGVMPNIKKAFTGEAAEIPPVKYVLDRGLFKDKEIWTRAFIYPVKNEDGTIKEVVLMHEDITNRKLIEENLAIEYSYRRAIEASIPSGIAAINTNGIQTYVNNAFCQMVGYNPEELLYQKSPFKYWPDEEMNNITSIFNLVISNNPPDEGFECRFKKKDDQRIDVLLSVNPILDRSSNITGYLASVSDITKLKNYEREIKESLKEKEILLKEVYHRVKNNLQIISSLLNLQSSYFTDKAAKQIFKESQNRVMSMALVHQKLYESKSQSKIDFAEYLNELVKYLIRSYNITPENINIEMDIEQHILTHDQIVVLGLIINELVSNAIKYAFPGYTKGCILISFKQYDDNHILKIKDDGVGFPDYINYKKTNTLGLQLVNNLVEQLGGKIELHSNGGAEFIILFKSVK